MHSNLRGHPALVDAIRRLERLNPDQFELYCESKASTKIDSKDQQIDALARTQDIGMAVRVVKDRKLGFSFTTSLEPGAIKRAVENAFEVASFMPEDPYVELPSFGTFAYPAVDNLDSKGLKAPIIRKIDLAKELEARCRAADARVTGVRSAAVEETEYEVYIVDSQGEHIEHRSSLFTASITCKAEAGGESQIGHEFDFSNFLDSLDVSKIGELAARWATELLGASSAPTMRAPAIFRNSVVAELLDFLSSSFSGEEIDKGRSMLAGKFGEPLFSDQVTIINDGLLAGGLATAPFDGEGIPSTQTQLVDAGFVANALYDTYYAKKFSKAPTGSAIRGIKAPPSIGPSNLYLKAGKKSFNALLDGISKGILITDLMGVHTANPVTGDFSLGASGILIENGKLTRPVRGFAVAGNVLEVFKRISDTGSDLKFFGSLGAPSVRVTEISVGGT